MDVHSPQKVKAKSKAATVAQIRQKKQQIKEKAQLQPYLTPLEEEVHTTIPEMPGEEDDLMSTTSQDSSWEQLREFEMASGINADTALFEMMQQIYQQMWTGNKPDTIRAMVSQADVTEMEAILQFSKLTNEQGQLLPTEEVGSA